MADELLSNETNYMVDNNTDSIAPTGYYDENNNSTNTEMFDGDGVNENGVDVYNNAYTNRS